MRLQYVSQILLWVIWCTVSLSVGQDVCRICECTFDTDQPFVVCANRFEVTLNRTVHNMDEIHEITFVNITKLRLRDQALASCQMPVDLTIHDVHSVELNHGFTKSLSSLTLENINSLYIDHQFEETPLNSLSLVNVKMDKLNWKTFHGVKSTVSVYINNLTVVREVEAGALNIQLISDTPSYFYMNRAKFYKVGISALVIEADFIMVNNSVIEFNEEGNQFHGRERVDLVGNRFGEPRPGKGLHLEGPIVNMTSNTWGRFDGQQMGDGQFYMRGNGFDDMDLGGVLLRHQGNISMDGNTLDCSCVPHKISVLVENIPIPKPEHIQKILRENYCDSVCMITWAGMAKKLRQGICDNNRRILSSVICSEPPFPPPLPDTSSTISASQITILVSLSSLLLFKI